MSKRHVGVALIVSAVLLVGVALLLWAQDSDDADADQLAEEYRAAINGDSPRDVDPNRTGPIALAAVSAVVFLGGIVLVSVPSSGS